MTAPTTLLRAFCAVVPAVTAAAQPVVATHYFYWYRWPDEHFDPHDDPRIEGHRHHFPEPEKVSYLDPAWHRAQFRAMATCGIDVALPVYWGAPGAYDRRGLRFARAGLGPMVEALDTLAARGEPRVRLGLFYDTSTLANDVRGVPPRGGRADLCSEAGKALFCRTIVDFFATIPPRHWARMRGRPLVVLYVSAFAARWDETLGGALRAAFAKRFAGERPFLVADASWGEIGQDATTSWGAALFWPRVYGEVVQIGPGYDDTPVPGRRTPIRDREDGAFYRLSWHAALRARPALVLIETWNEMHEGTEICETRETGTRYLDLTREYVRRLRAGEPPPPDPELRHATPRGRPDRGWGAGAAGRPEVVATFAGDETRGVGLRPMPWEDGRFSITGGRLVPQIPPERPGYVYFRVSDHWRYDTTEDLEACVVTEGTGRIDLQYDARGRPGPMLGAYAAAPATGSRREGRLTETRFLLRDAMLANRQNGGADLRLVVRGEVAVVSVRLRPAGQ